jgi:hypothetical protein
MDERIRAGSFSINGVDLAPMEATLDLARRLVDAQAEVAVEAILRRISGEG